jgi:hypothetical protein
MQDILGYHQWFEGHTTNSWAWTNSLNISCLFSLRDSP